MNNDGYVMIAEQPDIGITINTDFELTIIPTLLNI